MADRGPATVVAATAVIPGVLMLVFTAPGVIKNWSLVRPQFRVWNDDESPGMRHAKRLYNRFTWGWILTIMPGLILGALILA